MATSAEMTILGVVLQYFAAKPLAKSLPLKEEGGGAAINYF